MRPLPLRAPLIARLAGHLGWLLSGMPCLFVGLAAAGCTYTTDFDAPYPGDPASDARVADAGPHADLGGVCAEDCGDTVQCLDTLECEGSAFADVQARFNGYCRADCRDQNDNAYRVGQCTGQVYGDLVERYREAFEVACGAQESLCDAYCEGASGNGGAEPSLFELCVNRAEGPITEAVCKNLCGRLSLEFWRCVGAAQYDDPQAGECERERACLEAHPAR